MAKECWKDIPGLEGEYQVSDLGRVRSIPRYRHCIHKGREVVRFYRGKILSPGKRTSGHLGVMLGVNGGVMKSVHALVLQAFVGPRPKGLETLHLNHIPSDNRLVNLKYGTRSENIKMDFAAGKRASPGRPRPPKLNADQVKRVRSFKGISQRDLAKMFGVSQATIWAIRLDLGAEWKCKSGPKPHTGIER